MPISWTPDNDARLFAAVLATSDIKVDNAAVAARMGSGCTAKAIIHRIGKIKAMANTTIAAENADGGTKTPATTPTTTPKSRKRTKATDDSSTPTKKAKSAGTTSSKPAKKTDPSPSFLSTPKIVKKEDDDEGNTIKYEDDDDDTIDGSSGTGTTDGEKV